MGMGREGEYGIYGEGGAHMSNIFIPPLLVQNIWEKCEFIA